MTCQFCNGDLNQTGHKTWCPVHCQHDIDPAGNCRYECGYNSGTVRDASIEVIRP